jgi:hypothetical protein
MKYAPKSEEELRKLIQPGIWDWECLKAEEKKSKSGNQMLELLLKVYDTQGNSNLVNDYILETADWKIRHFAFSCALGSVYESGCIEAHMCVGQSGRCKGGIEKDKTGQYPDKNKIIDYLESDESYVKKQENKPDDLDDTEIPF